MGFLFADTSDLAIPGRMDLDELAFLGALAARVPRGGKIVEVGALYGRSTAVLARSNPDAQVFSIDTFENATWIEKYRIGYRDVPEFSLDAFRLYTGKHPNITAIQGFSPHVVQDWTLPIDMYFDDATHGNPALGQNLRFWSRHLQPGGILCGHDYGLRFPDVKREVDTLAFKWGQKVSIVGSLWALQKPESTVNRTCQTTAQLYNHLPLRLSGANKKAGLSTASSGYWLGAHLDADRLDWISVLPPENHPGLKLEIRLGHPRHGQTDWIPATKKVRLMSREKTRPFSRLAIRVEPGTDDKKSKVFYRVSTRQIGNKGARRSGVSDWASNGAWAHYIPEFAAVSSITVSIGHSALPHSQSALRATGRTKIQRAGKAVLQKMRERF